MDVVQQEDTLRQDGQHAVGLGMQLLQRLHEFDAAALAATARMDLRLHDERAAAKGFGMRLRFVGRGGDADIVVLPVAEGALKAALPGLGRKLGDALARRAQVARFRGKEEAELVGA